MPSHQRALTPGRWRWLGWARMPFGADKIIFIMKLLEIFNIENNFGNFPKLKNTKFII
jgi:hypothetical protein